MDEVWSERVEQVGGSGEWERGFNATYPTFVGERAVVKFYGGTAVSRATYQTERAVLERLGEGGAPRLLGWGEIDGWPYVRMQRMLGRSLAHVALDADARRAVASALGERLRRVHAIAPPSAVPRWDALGGWDVVEGARRSSLPERLWGQVVGYVADLRAEDGWVHGDVCDMHVFVDGGELSGLIDWGDALRVDPHYELIQLQRSVFGCDRGVLRVFLEAYGWRLARDFPRRALGWALVRQATGWVQHRGMDVFEPVAEAGLFEGVDTLDELAEVLFGV